MNPYANVYKGGSLAVRHYMLVDLFVGINTRAAQWVPEVLQVGHAEGARVGRSIEVYAAPGASVFGVSVSGSGCPGAGGEAAIVCTGGTTPQRHSVPLFAVACGDEQYVGANLYFFAPQRASSAVPIRAYACRDLPRKARPNVTLLGWFEENACAALTTSRFLPLAYTIAY